MARVDELEQRLNLLVRFGGAIGTETHLDRLLELIADQVRQVLAGDRCTVFLTDSDTGELWSKVAHGMGQTEIRVPMGKGIAGIVAETGQAINIPDAYTDPRFTHDIDRVTGYRTKNVLAVPLKNIRGDTMGVFQVLNKINGPAFDADDEGILMLMGSLAASAVENARLYENLRKSQLETIYRLAVTAEYRDQEDTAAHLRHISGYSHLIAKTYGLSAAEVEDIRYASPLHDIGKVAISDAILLKPGKLTPPEYEEMKKHAMYGAKILSNAESRLLQVACRVACGHHEKFDGTGYPSQVKGDAIPLEARIVAVADVFDALCISRVYKPAWEPDRARDYIVAGAGKAFDPDVVNAFRSTYDEIKRIHADLANTGAASAQR
ncbi:MAG: HD domain-containing phosphohydrolase [bacterium]